MHPMTQSGLMLLVMALAILTFLFVAGAASKLLKQYGPPGMATEKAVLAMIIAVAAVGALLMFIGQMIG